MVLTPVRLVLTPPEKVNTSLTCKKCFSRNGCDTYADVLEAGGDLLQVHDLNGYVDLLGHAVRLPYFGKGALLMQHTMIRHSVSTT